MFEYKYENLEFRDGFAKNTLEGHRQIIDANAKNGWRFVTAIPTKNKGYGIISEVDLVFEREIK